MFELSQTRNWLEKKERVRSASKALLIESRELRMDNPLARIAGLSGLYFVEADDYACEDRFEFLQMMAGGAEFTPKGLGMFLGRIQERKQGLKEAVKTLSGHIRTTRRIGKTLGVKANRVQMEVTRSLIALWLSGWARQIVPVEQIDWSRIELFMHVLHEFVFGASVKSEAATNDLVDMLNMLYVAPGEFYWTREISWNKRIVESGMGKYLVPDILADYG
ncbi:MAG: hypothetical protein JNM31_07840 [Flavobacteriales bacterium]|nr:hypothetical protein [Flavobacteriales bacterium]